MHADVNIEKKKEVFSLIAISMCDKHDKQERNGFYLPCGQFYTLTAYDKISNFYSFD